MALLNNLFTAHLIPEYFVFFCCDVTVLAIDIVACMYLRWQKKKSNISEVIQRNEIWYSYSRSLPKAIFRLHAVAPRYRIRIGATSTKTLFGL